MEFTTQTGDRFQLIDEQGITFFRHYSQQGDLLRQIEGEHDDLLAMFEGVQHGDQGGPSMDDTTIPDAPETPAVEAAGPGNDPVAERAQVDATGDIRKVRPVEISPGFMNPNASVIPEQDLPNMATHTRQASPDRTN